MYLKRIEMRGFKSFADKTEIVFQNGVTCVVGPNGSGKSNITDAVRWVLGEQRIKTLRGTKMEDVIFNGTKHRKSLGLAEVKLTFDNTSQFFPLDYDEITIIRKVHRSGDSEYYINQMPCRLKDVRELFMDTGIGREGYSIIGQGRIDEVLSNNKDERRLLFEEAAGIVKYKGRKIETERKLKSTEENLLRIKDILSEIEDRVEPLKKESERAKTYLDLTEMLKNIEVYERAKKIHQLLEEEKLVIEPLAYIRGRSLVNIFLIVDEAQNLTPHEVKTIITRAGEGSKIVFTGDIFQIDHPYLDSLSNGLSYLIEKMQGQPLYSHINLHKGERSELSELASDLL